MPSEKRARDEEEFAEFDDDDDVGGLPLCVAPTFKGKCFTAMCRFVGGELASIKCIVQMHNEGVPPGFQRWSCVRAPMDILEDNSNLILSLRSAGRCNIFWQLLSHWQREYDLKRTVDDKDSSYAVLPTFHPKCVTAVHSSVLSSVPLLYPEPFERLLELFVRRVNDRPPNVTKISV